MMKRIFLFIATTLTCICASAQKPDIHILATGGTIAGTGTAAGASNYTAGQVAVSALIEAVPQLQAIADITGEQIVNIGSQDMSDEVWLVLATRVNEILSRPETDGIVITHGTDTMEETAFFLSLTIDSSKPVVLTGAMRPSTAISADGPANLYNAVATAACPQSVGKGVLVVMNGQIHSAAEVTKTNTINVQAFQSPESGPIGYVNNGSLYYNHTPEKKQIFDISRLGSLPKVGILYSHAGIDADMAEAMLENGYRGIVHAGVGNGNIHKDIFPVLDEARNKGIQVVRSSRVPSGPVTSDNEVDDVLHQFIASGQLNPQKSRILLMLALTETGSWQEIQNLFNEY